jgi:hypothetical protein
VEQILPHNICPACWNDLSFACLNRCPASLIMILTPIGMMLAPTWSVQLFQWKFETALDAWYLPILGILLDLGLVYMIKGLARFSIQFAGLRLNPSHN